MYRVLPVDDEILIREEAQRISWKKPGIELVAVCENGQQTIEVLEKYNK